MTRLGRWLSAGLLAVPALTLTSGCVGPGYGSDAGVDIGGGYYEPYGYDYGGWGGGYDVGPYREGRGHFGGFGHGGDFGHGGGFEHGGPAGIPGGGGHAGGFSGGFSHGGGGHGR